MPTLVEMKVEGQALDTELLREIIDYLPIPIFVKDEHSAFVLSNRKHSELTGVKEASLLGRTTALLYGETAAQASRERDLPVLETGQETVVRRNYEYPGNKTFYLETRKARLIDGEGRSYVLGVNFDLTETRQREAHLHAMTESLPVGMVEFQEGKGVVFANRMAFEALGLDPMANQLEVVDYRLMAVKGFLPGNQGRHELHLDHQDERNPTQLLLNCSGWCRIPYRPEMSAFVTLSDVTELSELKHQHAEIAKLNVELAHMIEKLKLSQDELVKKGKLEQLGQLTATIAHELRNPLGAVRTSSYLLERKLGADSAKFKSQLERIANGVTRCDSIITQLLDFARSKALTMRASPLDPWLEQLLEEIAKDAPPILIINCDLGLGQRPIAFDDERLRRAILNTMQNAIEAMITKEGELVSGVTMATIDIATHHVEGFAVVEIKDSGPGIPPEVLARIREPLFTTKNFGTGLGVPAVERILEQHGGSMQIESALGSGTHVTLKWPAVPWENEQTVSSRTN